MSVKAWWFAIKGLFNPKSRYAVKHQGACRKSPKVVVPALMYKRRDCAKEHKPGSILSAEAE